MGAPLGFSWSCCHAGCFWGSLGAESKVSQESGHPGVTGEWHPLLPCARALGTARVLTSDGGRGQKGDGTVGKWAAVGAKRAQAGCRGQGASARPALPGVGRLFHGLAQPVERLAALARRVCPCLPALPAAHP